MNLCIKIKIFQSVRGVEVRSTFFWRNWIYSSGPSNRQIMILGMKWVKMKSFGLIFGGINLDDKPIKILLKYNVKPIGIRTTTPVIK